MLSRSIDATLRNLSTLMLVCAIVLAPLHLVYASLNRRAISVREMAPAIERFPEGRQVRSVGRAELDRERLSRWLLIGLELLVAVPLLLRPTRRVLAADDRGAVPTAIGAFRRAETAEPRVRPDPRVVVGGGLVALLVTVVAEIGVAVVVPMLGDATEWLGVAAGQTLARSLGVPFLMTALVLGDRTKVEARSLDLY